MQRISEESLTQEQKDRLKAALSKLKDSGIEASAVITRDGTMLAVDITAGDEQKIFAPMYAAMLGAAEEAISELRLGVPRRVVMEIGDKKLITVGAGPMALMMAMIGPGANYKKAVEEIDKTAAEVKSTLATPAR